MTAFIDIAFDTVPLLILALAEYALLEGCLGSMLALKSTGVPGYRTTIDALIFLLAGCLIETFALKVNQASTI